MISRTDTKASKSPVTVPSAPSRDELSADELKRTLSFVFETAAESSSLIANEYTVTLGGITHRIPKFLLLGQRGGGKPMNIGLFAGFDSGNSETARALSETILQLKASSGLTRDYALTAYPVVNLQGQSEHPKTLADFESRYARNSADQDVQFFLREFRVWNFEGIISVRRDARAHGFYAIVRSEIIAREVVEEAMAAAHSALPLAAQPVRIHASNQHQGSVTPRFAPPADVRPQPFDIELHLPPTDNPFDQADALYVTIAEILRHYRTFIVHAREL